MNKDTLDQKIKINPQVLYRLFARESAKHINGLSEPCYKIDTKTFEKNLYRTLGNIKPTDLRAVAKETFKDHRNAKHSQVSSEPFTFLLMYLYYKFAKANKKQMAETILLYSLLKHHGSEARKFMPKFCNAEVFQYTLNDITPVHLYRVHKTIANALIYLTKDLHKKYFEPMKRWDADPIYHLTTYSRNRIKQSMKSFAQAYYRNSDEGKGIYKQQEAGEDGENKNMFQVTTGDAGKQAAIEKFVKSMFVYKNYDRKAFDEAKKVSRVKPNIASPLLNEIHDKSSEEHIKIILTSFLKEVVDTKGLCNDSVKIVKKLMMVRNFKDTFVFKNLITNFTSSIIDKANPPTREIPTRDRNYVEQFVAQYIVLSFRNLFCFKR
jgi:hypothetical protein